MRILKHLTRLTLLLTAAVLASCSAENNDSRVVIGRGDTIIADNTLSYQKAVLIQVSDNSGVPQAGISVDIRLRALSFNKGIFTFTDDPDGDGTPDLWTVTGSATCNAEDTNNNGVLDGAEDTNANGILDPAVPVIVQHPSELPTVAPGTATLITDSNGQGYFAISYPRSLANWVRIELTAIANDGLPENRGVDTFTLPILIDDINDASNDPPGGLVGPYGQSASCADTV